MSPSYKGHRYPAEIISHCVWLYFRSPLSFREVEELMLERGVGAGVATNNTRPTDGSRREASAGGTKIKNN
ncbi:hypothetical protein ABT099_30030, partial [Streptomyces prasinus]